VTGEATALQAGLHGQPARVASNGNGMVSISSSGWPAGPNSNGAPVLLVEANGERLLLAGDIEAGAERAWLAATGDPRIDWLQSPHHGSRTSSTRRSSGPWPHAGC
jgi:hypothetical protein